MALQKKYKKNILISGGAGFIGSHGARLFVEKYPDYFIVNLDQLTYAGNPDNIRDLDRANNYSFVHGDINNFDFVSQLFNQYQFNGVIHFAAETHVDRSISDPLSFLKTNILGTVNLLEASKSYFKIIPDFKFLHVSTDEVFGSLGPEDEKFNECTPYDPRSPYSASKASSDHFVRAYFHTYGLPCVISNCSNNYGPNQFPEKLIPLIIGNILDGKPLPVYGKGENIRDWLFVIDHVEALDQIFHYGAPGETFTIGTENEWRNIDLIKVVCGIMDKKLSKPVGTSEKLITFVKDRPGHDLRYAINSDKIKKDLNWVPATSFEKGIEITIDWYLGNQDWIARIKSGDYTAYYNKQYGSR